MIRSSAVRLTLSALLLSGAPLAAQPGPVSAGRGPGRGAELFLARTGELKLTDAQVTRLAAIARRSDERRRALRAIMDSIGAVRRPGGPGPGRPDSAAFSAHTREMDRMRATMDRQRELARVELRDALAVLTPDQLATAWEMGVGPRGGQPGGAGRGMGVRQMRERGMNRRDGPQPRVERAPRRPSDQ